MVHPTDETRLIQKSFGKMLFKNSLRTTLALVWSIWLQYNVQRPCRELPCRTLQLCFYTGFAQSVFQAHILSFIKLAKCSEMQGCAGKKYRLPTAHRTQLITHHHGLIRVVCMSGEMWGVKN